MSTTYPRLRADIISNPMVYLFPKSPTPTPGRPCTILQLTEHICYRGYLCERRHQCAGQPHNSNALCLMYGHVAEDIDIYGEPQTDHAEQA